MDGDALATKADLAAFQANLFERLKASERRTCAAVFAAAARLHTVAAAGHLPTATDGASSFYTTPGGTTLLPCRNSRSSGGGGCHPLIVRGP